jgi:signal transduction histidine kinase
MSYKKIFFGFGILNTILLLFLIVCTLNSEEIFDGSEVETPDYINLVSSLDQNSYSIPLSKTINTPSTDKAPFEIQNFLLLFISSLTILPFLIYSSVVIKKLRKYRKRQNELMVVNKNKDLFFSIISHDLKAPAQHLISLSELACKNSKENYSANSGKINELMHDSAKKHYELLNNLLDWSKTQFTANHSVKTSCNLYDLIEEIVLSQNEKSKEKNILILNQIEKSLEINTNENIVNTVFRNILSNAIKFTPEYGQIICSSYLQESFIDIIIKDNGIGMSQTTLNNLFDIKYIRSLRGTHKEIGTGIGLILCKEILDKLNGRIKVISEENIGSTFIISLPL